MPIVGRLAGIGPDAALVAIKNGTGEVQGDGGRVGLQRATLQPRDQRPSPAGLRLQAVHPRARARRTGSTRTARGLRRRRSSFRSKNGHGQKVRSTSPTTRTRTTAPASLWSATAAFGQLGVRRARHEGEAAPRRAARAATWASGPMSRPTRRCCSVASRRASRRSRWRTPTRRSPTTACACREHLAPNATGPVAIQSVEERRRVEVENEQGPQERVFPAKVGQVAKDMLAARRERAARARPRRSATSSSGARPARPRTTATPGSWAATRT